MAGEQGSIGETENRRWNSGPRFHKLARPVGRGQSGQECSVLWAGDHVPPVGDITLDAPRTAPVRSTPVLLIRLDPLPPLPLASVQEDLHILVCREMSRQRLPKIWLVSRHDYQGSNYLCRLCFRRPAFDCHMPSLRAEWYSGNSARGYFAAPEMVSEAYLPGGTY
jgi:hypothetical protein